MTPHLPSELFHGLALLLLAGATWRLTGPEKRLPWAWLSGSAVCLACAACLKMVVPAANSALGSPWIDAGLTTVAAVMLLEFGRRGRNSLQASRLGAWIYAPLALLAGAAWIVGSWEGLLAGCRYAFGLPGGLLAAWAMWRAASGTTAASRNSLRSAAVAVLPLMPAVAALPSLVGFPIPAPMLQTLAALTAMTGLWFYRAAEAAHDNRVSWGRKAWVPGVVVLTIVAGMMATQPGDSSPGMRHVMQVSLADQATEASPDGQASGGSEEAVVLSVQMQAKAKPDPWKNVSDRRLRAGLPIVLGTLAGIGILLGLGVLANRHSHHSAS